MAVPVPAREFMTIIRVSTGKHGGGRGYLGHGDRCRNDCFANARETE